MPAPLINFPVSSVLDGVLSYLHYVFGKPEITPSEYRWDADERKSLIRISAPFVIDNEKAMSAPFVVVERGGFTFDNRVINNVKSGDANTMSNMNYVAIADGTINIICGSKEAPEASSLANYLAIMLQADRQEIMGKMSFLRNMYHLDIGPEIPVVKDAEVRRWEVTLRIFVSIQMGWIKADISPKTWESAKIWGTGTYTNVPLSLKGSTTIGSDLFVDTTQDFGVYTTNSPQLLEKELDKGWYTIKFNDGTSELYTVDEIVDNHTLRLLYHDANDDVIAWAAPATASDLSYNLMWNSLHLKVEIPNNNS